MDKDQWIEGNPDNECNHRKDPVLLQLKQVNQASYVFGHYCFLFANLFSQY